MRHLLHLLLFLSLCATSRAVESVWAYPGGDGRLLYKTDAQGNSLPDFSWCGYRGGGVAIPAAVVQQTLNPAATGDDKTRIQNAINAVAALAPDANGQRGAVLLTAGIYRVSGALNLASGVVLRGAGQDPSGAASTLLIGTSSAVMVNIGVDSAWVQSINTGSRQTMLDSYVPVGARRLRVANPAGFAVGDKVLVERPSTANWITAIGMNQISQRPGDPTSTKQWYAGKVDLEFERTVTAVDATHVTIDAPVVAAMETTYGGGTLVKFTPAARVREAGVEKLRLMTQYVVGTENVDQPHGGWGVTINLAENCWVSEVTGMYFAGGTVACTGGAARITVQDCANLDPVSTITGGRRYSFYVNGQQCLVQRCYSRKGRHDFVTGYQVVGTNAYLDCFSETTYADSGPHNCWATGMLYDNVATDDLSVQDRDYLGTGQGWAGANHVLWNCVATIICQKPPTANNWAVGCKPVKGNDFAKTPPRVQGSYDSWLTPVATRSLYLKQLSDRLGTAAVTQVTTAAQRAGSLTAALNTRYDEVSPAVQWPNLSALTDRAINVNATTGAIAFTVGDAQTAAASLTVTVTSSNATLVPVANIVLGGSGAARTVTVTPALNQVGVTTITLKVSDGALSASRAFSVTVSSTNDAPTLSAIADQTIAQDAAPTSFPFTVADDLTAPEALAVGVTSSNQTVVPAANVVVTDAWGETDIGNVAVEGTVSLGNVITMDASGADLYGTADEGHFLSQPMSGDGEMVARVLSLENTHVWAKAGVMMRQDTTSGSVNCYVLVSATMGVQLTRRTSTGGTSTSTGVAGISAPCWLRLVKSGSNFTGYYATETNDTRGPWLPIGGAVAIPALTGTLRAGIASTSHSDGTLSTSTYDHVTGSGNRLVTVTPAPNQFGQTTLTLTVNDGMFSTVGSFLLKVASPLETSGSLLSKAGDSSILDSGVVEPSATGAVLGDGGSSPWVNRCVVYVFQLPDLGGGANPFLASSLTFNYTGKDGTLKNNDLYGLGRRASPTVVAGDYYGTTATVDPGATKLQTSILIDSTATGLVSTSAAGGTALVNYLNAQYASGAGIGQYVFLRLNTAAAKSGVNRAFLTMSEGGVATPTDTRPQIRYTAVPGNAAPTISAVAAQKIALNSSTGAIPFTVGDFESTAGLQVSVASSNELLVPPEGMVVGGSGANRTVTVTPALMQSGTATLTLSVSDGALTTRTTFVVTVEGFAFLFNQDDNFEGWAANAVMANATLSSGALSATITGGDPQFNRATVLNLSGNHMPIVLVRMKSSAGGEGQLFFGNEVGGISAANSVKFVVAAGSAYQWYAVNVAANTNWAGHTIKALRFDPPGTTGTVAIDAIIASNGDFDHDGLPDLWEAANQLDPASPTDELLDSDGDGLSNAGEYALGSNPVAAAAAPLLTASTSGTTLTLSFTALSASGDGYAGLTRYYDVETTTDLADPASWTGLPGYTHLTGSNQTLTVPLPISGGPRFYRLKVRVQP